MIRKNLDSPEETRPFEEGMGKLELVNLDRGPVGRATFEPGWQWSKHVKPIAGTDSCQAAHMGYFISGRMKSSWTTVRTWSSDPVTLWNALPAMTPGSLAMSLAW